MTYPALAVAMTRSLGIALSTEDAQRLHERLQDIASQLVLQEREACAKLMQSMRPDLGEANPYADAIRARGRA